MREAWEVSAAEQRRPRCWLCGSLKAAELDARERLFYEPLCSCGPPWQWIQLSARATVRAGGVP